MARAAKAGDATMTETDDTGTCGTTTRTALMGHLEAIVHGVVREIMGTPVLATAATILATETTMCGGETRAGARALEGIIQGVNPHNENVLRIEAGAGALLGNANEAQVETRRMEKNSSGGQTATTRIKMTKGE